VHFLWFIISLVALTFLIAVTDFLCLAALSESGASLLPFALSTPQISVIHPVDFPAFLGISSGFAMGRLGRRSSESRFGAKSYKLASSSLLCEGWSRWSAQNVRLEKKSKFQDFFDGFYLGLRCRKLDPAVSINQNFQARVIPEILFIFYFIRNVIFISNVSLVTAR